MSTGLSCTSAVTISLLPIKALLFELPATRAMSPVVVEPGMTTGASSAPVIETVWVTYGTMMGALAISVLAPMLCAVGNKLGVISVITGRAGASAFVGAEPVCVGCAGAGTCG